MSHSTCIKLGSKCGPQCPANPFAIGDRVMVWLDDATVEQSATVQAITEHENDAWLIAHGHPAVWRQFDVRMSGTGNVFRVSENKLRADGSNPVQRFYDEQRGQQRSAPYKS